MYYSSILKAKIKILKVKKYAIILFSVSVIKYKSFKQFKVTEVHNFPRLPSTAASSLKEPQLLVWNLELELN